MAALVILGVVITICLTVLLLVWTDRRRTARREALQAAACELHEARSTITRVEAELQTQWDADYPDIPALRRIIMEHRQKESRP